MNIITDKRTGRVLYFGRELLLSASEARGEDWTDASLSTANASLFEVAVLPQGFMPGAWFYDAESAAWSPDYAKLDSVTLQRYYDNVVQARLDAVARDEFRYGDPNRPDVSPILHAISYAEESAVPKFQAEGRALRAWRSLTWAAATGILEAVEKGDRGIPSAAELLAELEAVAPAPTAAALRQ